MPASRQSPGVRALFCVSLLLAIGACDRKPAAPAPPAAPIVVPAIEVHGRQVDVRVKMKGYEPSRIKVRAGEDVTLVFLRSEPNECAAEVAFPSLGIKKELPVGKPVAIPIRAEKPGEIAFACGMDMMKGKLEVSAVPPL